MAMPNTQTREPETHITVYKPCCTVRFCRNNSGTRYETVDWGATVPKPPDPVRRGCAFAGWYTGRECWMRRWNFAEPVTHNLSLYAKWTPSRQR